MCIFIMIYPICSYYLIFNQINKLNFQSFKKIYINNEIYFITLKNCLTKRCNIH